MHKNLLEKYRLMEYQEKKEFEDKKLLNDRYKKFYYSKLKISGLHVEISRFEEPIWLGVKRDAKSVQMGAESRKKSKELKAQMENEIQEFLGANPDTSVTNNPEKLLELHKIKDRYKEQLKSRDDNTKRKVRALRDKIQSNFDIWTHFITLSFQENLTDLSLAKSRFKDWTQRMEKIIPNFKYIYVVEFQERGAIHFHVIASLTPGRKTPKEIFNKIRHSWNWGANTNGIQIDGIGYKYVDKKARKQAESQLQSLETSEKVKAVWSVGNYLTSYLDKDADSVLLFGSKMYGASQGLKSAIEVTDPKKIELIKRELGLDRLQEKTYEIEIKETENKVIKSFYNLLIEKPKDKSAKDN